MLVWTGMGFLVGVFVFGSSLVANLITIALLGESYYDEHKWPLGIAMIVAAALCWFTGQSLANSHTRHLIDQETGEELIVSPNHSFFFIKMHWWGLILLVIGATLFVSDLMK